MRRCSCNAAGKTLCEEAKALFWGPMKGKPALRVELIAHLTFLAAFALLVGVATSLLALALPLSPVLGISIVVILVAFEAAVFAVSGRSLVAWTVWCT